MSRQEMVFYTDAYMKVFNLAHQLNKSKPGKMDFPLNLPMEPA